MGRIFGISDLPVSTIMTPFSPIEVVQSKPRTGVNCNINNHMQLDSYIKAQKLKKTNLSSIRNFFGKLMKG